MRNNPIIVQKYGGACLETPAKIRAVASSLADLHSRGHRVVAIVSAMGNTTDELVKMAYQVSPHPNRRELDMLLTTGERISMSLISMALSDLGVPAISFTGSQAGVMTDDSHSSARILDVRPIRVREELDRGRIVVLAGFQGVNPVTKEITTLDRGGSDTTAVAMAAVLKAECCEIIKEIDGVCSADPRIVANSKPLRQLDFSSLSEMCFWGAKVLHFRSVELAQSQNVPLVLKKWGGAEHSTQVMKERPRIACCRHGPGSPAASARIQPVLRCSSPSRPSRNRPAFVATRSCLNNGRIRLLISRSDAAHNASVSSIDAARVHDLRIMVAHRFRNLQKRQL